MYFMKYLAIFTIVIILFFIYRNYKNSQFLNINFKKFIILIISFEFVMIFFIIYELNVLDRLESAMATLQLEKYDMVLVAKVLRQSSDDLSHYARSYAVTNNTEYGILGDYGIRDYNDAWNNGSSNDPGPNGISLDPLFSNPSGLGLEI